MPIEELNRFFESIGTGKIVEGFSFDQIAQFQYVIYILIFLGVFLSLWTSYHKRKGTFTRPSVSPSLHREEIDHTINCELKDLYSRQSLVDGIVQKLGGYRQQGRLQEGQLSADSIMILPSWRMGFVFVTKYALNRKEEVANGNFGRIMLNRDFFTSRTMHHHYCMMIAAKLFFFQAYALAGKEPKGIQSNEKFTKKAGETVLSLAGKLQEYSSLREHEVISLTRNDFRIDDDIAHTLNIGEKDIKNVEGEFESYSRSIHDLARGNWHVVMSKEKKLLELLKKEKCDLEVLIVKAIRKKGNVEQLLKGKSLVDDERYKLTNFLNYWEAEIARLRMICASLDNMVNNQDNWEFKHSPFHHLQRISKSDTSDVSNKLHEESVREKIDINKVHAILTSFTEAKSNLLRLMHSEEAVI